MSTESPYETTEPHIIIIGTGIIGLSTAFYLTTHHPELSSRITLLDSSPTLFACASGRAAGFLAKDWFGSETISLGRLSFDLHRELAKEFDGARRWGYTGSVGLSYSSSSNSSEIGKKRGEDWLRAGESRDVTAGDNPESEKGWLEGIAPKWLRVGDGTVSLTSTEETTAQMYYFPSISSIASLHIICINS